MQNAFKSFHFIVNQFRFSHFLAHIRKQLKMAAVEQVQQLDTLHQVLKLTKTNT